MQRIRVFSQSRNCVVFVLFYWQLTVLFLINVTERQTNNMFVVRNVWNMDIGLTNAQGKESTFIDHPGQRS